ncbi:hypothetical protein SHK09_02270 [Polaribacter sp. PL03]|uniref:hypothetical protein n=1 Tax=Polaribacter sp. PL03 TaxID=3088353 RepID=UPI0029CD0CAB|nr:hypothetical protein [Polaribacter sp. PL03]MDX6745604.1 hypothetical protein [Polaribacter sp. PL03]
MEHDIRNMFDEKDFKKKELPEFHKDEFLIKLKKSSNIQKKNTTFFSYKYAAILVVIGVLCFFRFSNTNTRLKQESVLLQVENIEKVYFDNIDKEWNSFLKITNDSILVDKYQVKLYKLSLDYKKITAQFNKHPNSINVLESLVDNLQRRLQLIRDIKDHINELNQKNTSNETIYL